MKRLLMAGRLSALAILAGGCFCTFAAASHPDILRNYRFIPSHSTVHVSGGFAGVDWDLQIAGKFGLVTGYQEGYSCLAIGCPPPPTHLPYAQFVDVDAILYDPRILAPIPLPGWDLDETLNLSGLSGTFQLGEPNRLFFHGKDGQGQPIRLRALLRDRLIRIVGENDPVHRPDGSVCADCFGYKIDAVAHLIPHADFNLDGLVDAADYVVWRKALEHAGAGADASGGGDYDLWRTDFGDAIDLSELADLSLESGGVPEPTTAALFILGAMILRTWLRRRR
jgi:hypothetical protein